MKINFKGKNVLVTGAGRGIGRELCKALVKAKAAKVYALSKTKKNLDSLVSEEPSICPIVVDLSDWDAVRDELCSLEPIDCLVNNAGVAFLEPFFEIQPESIDSTIAVNVKAVINVSQIIARGMAERKCGSIVNVSSRASKVSIRDLAVYCGSKTALDAVTQSMALQLGKYNIRVNTVNPSVVWTDMGKMAWGDTAKSQPLLDRTALGRFAEPDEVINAILFLLSDKASMITAVSLLVDGGAVTN